MIARCMPICCYEWMPHAELWEQARPPGAVHSSAQQPTVTKREPKGPADSRDTVPDFEDDYDDAEWEDDFALIGDDDDDLESTPPTE